MLAWFLGAWLQFHIRLRWTAKRLYVERSLLRQGAPVEVLLRRHPYRGTAEVATDSDDPATVRDGVRRYMDRFPAFARKLGIDDPATFDAHARRSVIVRVRLDR